MKNKHTPLNIGQPESWPHAENIEQELQRQNTNEEMKWSFDCNFKLDYDGGIVTIYSRFYPPNYHKQDVWSGNVSTYLIGDMEPIKKVSFECDLLEQLKIKVEVYVKNEIYRIKSLITKATQP